MYLRQGHWKLVGLLFFLGVSLSPISPIDLALGIAVLLVPFVGLGGLLWLIRTARTTRAGTESIMRRYLSHTRHGEKLGLQALIGDELRALVTAWVPLDRFRWGDLWPELAGAGAVALLWAVSLGGFLAQLSRLGRRALRGVVRRVDVHSDPFPAWEPCSTCPVSQCCCSAARLACCGGGPRSRLKIYC